MSIGDRLVLGTVREINGEFVLQLHKYAQDIFPKFEDIYVEKEASVVENHYRKPVMIYYTIYENVIIPNEENDNEEEEPIELWEYKEVKIGYFYVWLLKGANNDFSEKIVADNRRYWRGLPFSMLSEDLSTRYFSVNELNLSDAEVNIETTEDKPCNGIYLKWLALDTNYYYWFFPYVEESEKTKDLGVVDRWFIDEEFETSNQDTRGVTREETMTVKDKVSRKYWNMLVLFILLQRYIS